MNEVACMLFCAVLGISLIVLIGYFSALWERVNILEKTVAVLESRVRRLERMIDRTNKELGRVGKEVGMSLSRVKEIQQQMLDVLSRFDKRGVENE